MRSFALAFLAVLLGGCQTVNSTWRGIASSDAPAAPPSATTEAAKPAAPPRTAMATPTAPATSLTGQSGEALLALWGEPSLRRKDLGSEMWQYAGKGCAVLVYLYPANGVLTVSHAEAVPGGKDESAIATCAKAAGKPPIKPTS